MKPSSIVFQVADTSRAIARERWRLFRGKSAYHQLRVALVVGYVGVVFLTLVLAPPPPTLVAYKLGSVPWGMSSRTYIDLTNLRLGTVSDLVLEVHGSVTEFDGKQTTGPWMHLLGTFPEGQSVRIWPEQLIDGLRRPAGNALHVDQLILKAGNDTLFDEVVTKP